ncbi:glycosyltransferase [Candidatus Saccharibacteria bacterium]|nr:glycosyltransferase [Candidatus Saccharibacteria bacterium]
MKVNIYKNSSSVKLRRTHTVAAVIPNYNYENFIIERIDSILFQTYPISELIILDDASPDNSVEIINEKISTIKKEHPKLKIKFIINEKNSGGCVFSQWQKGIKEVTSDYIWIAEADDSCDCHFLETAMKKFDDYETAVLFYSDSYRINQNNVVKSTTCSDWADMWKSGRYNSDFFNEGKNEIKYFLSGTNPIMNVSSVVWKNQKNLPDIFEEAKKYKVAGDWYIYSRVLEYGDIVYSSKPLNYYRKHDQGSASTNVKLLTEYNEVCSVQNSIAKRYKLTPELLEWQKVRRRGMGFTENNKNIGTKGRIAWLIPWFSSGSGGHRTIFSNINRLVDHGYQCDAYIQTLNNEYPSEILERIREGYGEFKGDVFAGYTLADKKYDMVFATGWDTAEPVSKTKIKHKMYFIQDFEPWFFAMGSEYLTAEDSYRLNLDGITIGKWLSEKISSKYPMNTNYFNFCADLGTYKKLDNIKKEDAICLIFQPGKPRRCDKIALKALQIVQEIRPKTKIYLYGSMAKAIHGLNVTHLGEISTDKCNELYNKCSVGICMSASNPSRIPFEMMAAGLPVVELYHENNLYDFPEKGCLLAQPNPESIATAILEVLNNKELRMSMSEAGNKYMQDYPIEKGYTQFIDFVDKVMAGEDTVRKNKIKKSYTTPPVEASEKVKKVSNELKKEITYGSLPTAREMVRGSIPRRVIRKSKNLIKKTINFIKTA